LKKILIANRGEIAVRIIRTCRAMGVRTVAVYSDVDADAPHVRLADAAVAVFSDCDRQALHVRLADEAYPIGPDAASESYLRIDTLIDVSRRSGADAVHPGYGFLAENPEFADACRDAGLTFIGPSGDVMRAMGSKTAARAVATAAGIPVVPGGDSPDAAGYPLLVKAVAGGGGKGMRVVRRPAELDAAIAIAQSEARSSFGDGRVYFERLLDRPRHIEVQILGDREGAVVPFVERECSIQRRHQKLIEETPSAAVTSGLRDRLMAAAETIGRTARYTSAGTVEFLVDGAGAFYFLEMNTRLQVEHPVTEAVTGIDFVRAQIALAGGATLADLNIRRTPSEGHAIEVRVYAEDPAAGFLPSPGRITHLRAPSGPGIRDDSGAYEGWTVPTAYDPLVSKVIAWAPDRAGAVSRMVRALSEYDLRGISTTIGFCRQMVGSAAFAAGDFDTTTVDRALEANGSPPPYQRELEETAAIAAAIWTRTRAGAILDRRSRGNHTDAASRWTERARWESLR
jgi:acetyl-CoA carboxylase biotin carboxylase subunit